MFDVTEYEYISMGSGKPLHVPNMLIIISGGNLNHHWFVQVHSELVVLICRTECNQVCLSNAHLIKLRSLLVAYQILMFLKF
jgi:hypothetical protein